VAALRPGTAFDGGTNASSIAIAIAMLPISARAYRAGVAMSSKFYAFNVMWLVQGGSK
jgi:hypothetical protein